MNKDTLTEDSKDSFQSYNIIFTDSVGYLELPSLRWDICKTTHITETVAR